jgi:hypothetical protein
MGQEVHVSKDCFMRVILCRARRTTHELFWPAKPITDAAV